jgi:hypothetical protein
MAGDRRLGTRDREKRLATPTGAGSDSRRGSVALERAPVSLTVVLW